jgi:adenylate kinase
MSDGLLRHLARLTEDEFRRDPSASHGPSATGIADILWMARFLRQSQPTGESAANQPTAPQLGVSPDEQPADPADSDPAAAPRKARPTGTELHSFAASGAVPGAKSRSADTVRVRAVPAMQNTLEISRALRPLKRRVARPQDLVLAEGETATTFGETQLIMPVWYPAEERWLQVDLVVDTSPSMALWRRTAAELQALLEQHGAFRNVRVWALDGHSSAPRLTPLAKTSRGTSAAAHSAAELVDPAGRRAILVLTDAVGSGWRDGTVMPYLLTWARTCPVAIVQVLPRRLWDRTALRISRGEGRHVPTARPPFRFRDADGRSEGRAAVTPSAAWIPVLQLSGEWLRPWAAMLAGTSEKPARMFAIPLSADPARAGSQQGNGAGLSATEQLRNFEQVTASAQALELAGYLAVAARLTLPIMRLVQRTMLPDSGQDHLAEVLFSGLIVRDSQAAVDDDPDAVLYDFRDGIRQQLLGRLTKRASLQVIDVLGRVSDTVARRFGGPDFRALASRASGGQHALPAESLPFALITTDVLKGLGGEYADLARSLADAAATVAAPADSLPASGSQDDGSSEPEPRSEPAAKPPFFEDTSARLWKVYVSSTSAGLTDLRAAAREVIDGFRYEGRRCFRPIMMEDFVAEDSPAREVCTNMVRDCDVLVGIIGNRYGAHPPGDQASYTEIEYQTAVEQRLSRLMFLLDERVARELEPTWPRGEDQADRQRQFRERVATDQLSDMSVDSVEGLRRALHRALEAWVENESFKPAMVNHAREFRQARARLLQAGGRAGGAALIFGAPGTGKTTLVTTLLDDVLVRRAYARLIGPVTIQLADGADEVRQRRAEVQAALDELAAQQAGGHAALPPVLIMLRLESDIQAGRSVARETLPLLSELFSWNVPRVVVLAEANSSVVTERLERDLGWPADAVITVGDYDNVEDALEQMRRDAPDVRDWPQPETRILAEALGLRPVSLFTAAKDIEADARRAPRLVPARIRRMLDAIAREDTPEGKHDALVRGAIDSLSPPAKDLLALMTVLHPKPTLFPDGMAVALDLALDLDEAIEIALTDDDSELGEEQLGHRDEADELVGELVERGLLERMPPPARAGHDAPPQLTMHPANRRAICESLPLPAERRAAGHARAEAFYRARVGETVGGSFEDRFRMEDDTWGDDSEEWIYHLGHITPGRTGIAFAALFLDAYWWWDLYVPFDFCRRLLAYASRPRVRAVSPDMPQVARLLGQFRAAYPREHDLTMARLYAEIADGGPDSAPGLREAATRGAGIIPIVRELCDCLQITELDPLFPAAAPTPGHVSGLGDAAGDRTRLHLLGLLSLFLAKGFQFRAELEATETGLAAAEACYRYAEACFLAEEDDWDVAWTRFLLGEVIGERGRDPGQYWDAAAAVGDDDSDTELLANIERARADRLHARDHLDGALPHYGRAVFYGMTLQVTSNLETGADAYTQAFYREVQLRATKVLAEPLLASDGAPPEARLAEARRRLAVMLHEWGGSWEPDPAELDAALRSASPDHVEKSAVAIADAAFPPGPGGAVLGQPASSYYRQVQDRIEQTRTQPWVAGLARWESHRQND